VVVHVLALRSLTDQFHDSIVSRAENFASLVKFGHDELEFDFPGSLAEPELGVFLRITSDEGSVLSTSPDWPPIPTPIDPQAPETAEPITLPDGSSASTLALFRHAIVDDEDVNTKPTPVVVVQLCARSEHITRAGSAIGLALAVGALVACAGALLAANFGVSRGLRTVRALGSDVDGLSPADASGRIPTRLTPATYSSDLVPIVDALNGLLDRQHLTLERERRFSDAAAHELRTPIAELSTIAQVASMWPEPARLADCARQSAAVAVELTHLIESLLALARGNPSTLRDPELAPLMDLCRHVISPLAAKAPGGDIALVGDDAACWRTSRGDALIIVRNLIQNAVDYTLAGGFVRITIVGDNAAPHLVVENGPVSLTPEQLEHFAEPFWRADPARTDRAHQGLGLSIVDAVAARNGLVRTAHLQSRALVTRIGPAESPASDGQPPRPRLPVHDGPPTSTAADL